MNVKKHLGTVAVVLFVFVAVTQFLPTKAPAAGPINLGQTQISVADFGADNTGGSDSTAAIQAAINSCDSTLGCEVYFPSGVYALDSAGGTSPLLTVPANVPITLAGAGPLGSVIEAIPPVSQYIQQDIIAVGSGATGFTAHDLSVQVFPTPHANPNGATAGAVFHLPSATSTNIFNINVSGGYDILQFGSLTSPVNVNQYTYIRSINSFNGNHCFMRMDGGVSDTYVRGIFAEANETTGSQILCHPSIQSAPPLQFPGISRFHLQDSSFEGFTRGFSFDAAQFNLQDIYLDNLFLDTAANGPSFETVVPPLASSIVSNVNISNTTVISASTACVIRGGVVGVRLNNVSCDGGTGGKLPATCPPPTHQQRGFALLEVAGSATSLGSVSVTVGSSVISPITVGPISIPIGSTSPEIANLIGQAIFGSPLVVAPGQCPTLVPPQTFNDYVGGVASTDYSIGPDLELYAYNWSNNPTISVATTGSGFTVLHPNVSSTFAPADGIYVGAPTGSTPRSIAVTGTSSERAQNGIGLHLQGGTTMLFNGNHLGGAAGQNLVGVQVERLGVSYQNVQIRDNDLTNNARTAVIFAPVLSQANPLAPNSMEFSDNLAFNPVGYTPYQPTTACGTPTTNPFPYSTEVYIFGTFTSISKNSTIVYPTASSAETVSVFLGVGESITIACSALPSVSWFGQ